MAAPAPAPAPVQAQAPYFAKQTSFEKFHFLLLPAQKDLSALLCSYSTSLKVTD